MKKEGISHIEVLLSFLIFIGFVIFAFYFFSPIRTSRLVESSLTYTINEITEDTIVELETYSVKMNVTGGGIKRIKIKDIDKPQNVRVENRHGIEVPSKRDANTPHIDFDSAFVHDGDENNGFAIFKFSEDFSPGELKFDGDNLNKEDYTIIFSDTFNLISEKRIIALNDSYYNDYVSLKEKFNLPSQVSFEFEIIFNEEDKIEAIQPRPENVEIFSDAKRVEILRKDDSIIFADLIVRIW